MATDTFEVGSGSYSWDNTQNYDSRGYMCYGTRNRSKFHVNQYVYHITNEMIYNGEVAVRLMIDGIDYDIRYRSYMYSAVPTDSTTTLGRDTYRENDLLAETTLIKKIRKVKAQMKAEDRKRLDSRHNVQNGGHLYAMYRYSQRKRK